MAEWKPNETQKTFLGALEKDSFLSLRQINAKLGTEIKTGSVVILKTKGLMETKESAVEYTAVVKETRTYSNGDVIEIEKTKTESETGYRLV